MTDDLCALNGARDTDGFFDAGMLLQALKAGSRDKDDTGETAVQARKYVGKKLQLSEY